MEKGAEERVQIESVGCEVPFVGETHRVFTPIT